MSYVDKDQVNFLSISRTKRQKIEELIVLSGPLIVVFLGLFTDCLK